MKYYSLFIVICMFISCEKKYTKFEKVLLEPSKKWVYYKNFKKFNKDSARFLSYMKFQKDGIYFNYYLDENIQYGEMQHWNYSDKDSELQMINYKFVVLQVNEDSIILKNIDDNTIVKLLNHNALQ